MSGVSFTVTNDMIAPWNEAALPTFLSNYELENIFNANEVCSFTNASELSPIIYLGKNPMVGKAAKFG